MSEKRSYIFTGVKSTCTGCGTCSLICAKQALSMKPDAEGFLYPVLDVYKCVNCGLCDSRCPVVNNDFSNKTYSQHCFLATTFNEYYYKNSASIGICTMLSKYIISLKGVVFGCYLDETNWESYHIGVTDDLGIQKIRNSKYLQSNTIEAFSKVKNLLTQGTLVLYIGTPCQISGLKAYLFKEYENLYTVDLFCHGVFSPKLMNLEVDYWQKKLHGTIKNFRFRSKRKYQYSNGGMINFDLVDSKGKEKHIERYAGSSPTYYCFAYSKDGFSYNLRQSCYSCIFKSKNRYADISIGDPWCIRDESIQNPLLNNRNCIRSLYTTNTIKGSKLINEIRHLLIIDELTHAESFVQPAVLPEKREIPVLREYLFNHISNQDYGKLIEQMFHCNLGTEHEKFVRRYKKEALIRILKKFL